MNNHSSISNYDHLSIGLHSSFDTHFNHHSAFKTPRQDQLKHKIIESYLSYLNRDDTPDKLIHRNKLEQLITEYLSMVPHCDKFETTQVAECLDRSIIENSEFSAYRAAAAFEILEKYANNLLTKPWRKEFQTISPYGGFFTGLVERQLRGALNILEILGYRNRTINGVNSFYNAACALDPDLLTRVSLDCLVAVVEFQMMIKIADSLKRKGVQISWLQIFEIKSNHVCSMDEVVNYVLESIDDKCLLGSNHFSGHYPANVRIHHQNGCPLRDHLIKRNDHQSDDVPHSDGHVSYDLMHFTDHQNINSPYHGPLHNIPYIAPPPMFASNNFPYAHGSNQGMLECSLLYQSNKRHNINSNALDTRDTIDSRFNSLSIKPTVTKNKSFDKRKESPQEAKKVLKDVTSMAACVNNLLEENIASLSKSLPKDARSKKAQMGQENEKEKIEKSDKTKQDKSTNVNNISTEEKCDKTWSCAYCTFINSRAKDICEMCSRSKEEKEEVSLVSGGKVCPRCTLVNLKEAKNCSACESCLLSSPTYI